jgi:glutamyl-tRNA synthetase
LPLDDLTENLLPFFAAAGLIGEPAQPAERELLAAATPLIQERINTLSEAVGMLAFLFLPDDKITIAPDAGLSADSVPTLRAAYDALAAVPEFDHGIIEAALRTALVEDLGLKPRLAFGPVRAAITGSRISPPLFESIELLGRESTLERIAAALAELGEPEVAGSGGAARRDTRAARPER